MCVGSAQGSGVGLLFSHDCEQDCHEDVPGLYKNVYSGTKKSFFRSIERERKKSFFIQGQVHFRFRVFKQICAF